jgi:branched-chain amino acid aminotransferase
VNQYFNLNGELISISHSNSGLNSWANRYGFGLFETMLFQDGQIQKVGFHWERLEAGMRLLKIPFPKNYRDLFLNEIFRTLEANKLSGTCRIRLQVTAGSGSFFNRNDHRNSFLIEATEWNLPDHSTKKALKIGMSQVQKHTGPYAQLKSCNALPYVLAAQEAIENALDDVLLMNERHRIVESTIANIFWLENGTVFTPSISEGCVAGIMRRHLLEILPEKGFRIETSRLTRKRLFHAEAVFLTNALRGIMPVKEIDGQKFPISPIENIITAAFDGAYGVS